MHSLNGIEYCKYEILFFYVKYGLSSKSSTYFILIGFNYIR